MTATFSPVFNRAVWTWATEAAAILHADSGFQIGLLSLEDDLVERVQLLERMLVSEVEERVPELTLKVAAAYADMEDRDGELRALEQGYRRVPGDEGLRQRLEDLLDDPDG